jgi:hypothetical protein
VASEIKAVDAKNMDFINVSWLRRH